MRVPRAGWTCSLCCACFLQLCLKSPSVPWIMNAFRIASSRESVWGCAAAALRVLRPADADLHLAALPAAGQDREVAHQRRDRQPRLLPGGVHGRQCDRGPALAHRQGRGHPGASWHTPSNNTVQQAITVASTVTVVLPESALGACMRTAPMGFLGSLTANNIPWSAFSSMCA